MTEMNNNNNKNSMSSQHQPQQTILPENSIRKYLVLLHDCLAIKFVPLVAGADQNRSSRLSSRCNSPFQQYNPPRPSSRLQSRSSTLNHNYSSQDHQQFNFDQSNGFEWNHHNGQKRSTINRRETTLENSDEVDHSLHGLYLYKGFREANLQCYWNSGLYDAIRNLEYKGYIVPSTLLIWSLPRFLTILRQAWSRQMLRSPPGYKIEFVGEIEELIADPIQQSQFAPLSDSLCWAILEITSLGQEAFVDSILLALKSSFPTMVGPSKELIYQTLEKLIRERKIYQTSHGYFVVTPDTFRYMISSNNNDSLPTSPIPPQQLPPIYPQTFSTNTLTIDEHEIITSNPNNQSPTQDQSDKMSRNSWESTHSDSAKKESSKKALRRHNSLKMIRQRDKESTGPIKFLRGRSLSFRLYKSKSTPLTGGDSSTKENAITNNDSTEDCLTATSEEPTKSKGSKSFFKRLFKRSSSKTRNSKEPKISIETQTQTQPTVNVPVLPEPEKIALGTVNNNNNNSSPPPPISDEITCLNERSFTLPNNHPNHNDHLRWNNSSSLPKQSEVAANGIGIERPTSRLSIDSSCTSSPLYATIENQLPLGSGNNNFPSLKRGCSSSLSRYSTLSSQGTGTSSLGYGTGTGGSSQGQASTSLGFTSPSPCPTPAPGTSYKTYYDYYRRRYPGYGSQRYYRPLSGPPTMGAPATPSGNANGNSNQHRYEVIRNANDKLSSTPIQQNKTPNSTTSSTTTTTTTTKVTQNSTTNMEVELRLPLRKLMGTNYLEVTSNNNNKGSGCSSTSTSTTNSGDSTITKVNVNVVGSKLLQDQQEPTKIILGHPNGPQQSETIKTIVKSNGRIETHFDTCSSGSPTEIQLRAGVGGYDNCNSNKGAGGGLISNCASCHKPKNSNNNNNCAKEEFI